MVYSYSSFTCPKGWLLNEGSAAAVACRLLSSNKAFITRNASRVGTVGLAIEIITSQLIVLRAGNNVSIGGAAADRDNRCAESDGVALNLDAAFIRTNYNYNYSNRPFRSADEIMKN